MRLTIIERGTQRLDALTSVSLLLKAIQTREYLRIKLNAS